MRCNQCQPEYRYAAASHKYVMQRQNSLARAQAWCVAELMLLAMLLEI